MVRLEVIAGNAVGTSIDVDDELVIGRLADGPGRLADDDEISRSHARLAVDAGGTCAIEDLGSTNGTFVNGMRISAPRVLAEGDTIEVGGTSLVVRELPGPSRLQPTVVPGTPVPLPPEAAVPPPEAPLSAPEEPLPPPAAQELPGEEPPTKPQPPALAEPSAEPALPLSLQLTVDFEAREARIALNDESEPLRLVFEGGVWRAAPIPPSQEG